MGSSKKIATDGLVVFPTDSTTGITLSDSGGKLAYNSVKLADSDDITTVDGNVLAEKNARDANITSLDTRVGAEKTARDANITSLDTRVGAEEDMVDGTSLAAKSIGSLDARLADEEAGLTYQTITLDDQDGNGGNGLVNITYSMDNTPAIAGMIRQQDGSKPILSCMLIGLPTSTTATFQLSGNTHNGSGSSDYYLDLIVADDTSTT